MSHTMTMPLPRTAPFNWRRSSALSATMAFHAAVFALLFLPPALQQIAPAIKTESLPISVPKPEPKEIPLEALKPPPPPKHHEKTVVTKTPPPLVKDVVVTNEVSPMATPPIEATPGPITPTDIAPAETAPTPMAYGKRRAVPYPISSMKRNEQGKVILKVLIGSDGVPQRIEIAASSGFPSLDKAAREAVMKWQFTAGTRGGVPYEAWAMVPIEFHLDRS